MHLGSETRKRCTRKQGLGRKPSVTHSSRRCKGPRLLASMRTACRRSRWSEVCMVSRTYCGRLSILSLASTRRSHGTESRRRERLVRPPASGGPTCLEGGRSGRNNSHPTRPPKVTIAPWLISRRRRLRSWRHRQGNPQVDLPLGSPMRGACEWPAGGVSVRGAGLRGRRAGSKAARVRKVRCVRRAHSQVAVS